jgi:hypothetical protein
VHFLAYFLVHVRDAPRKNRQPPKKTATTIPLTKDLDGDPADGSFNYASVIGMLGYVVKISRCRIELQTMTAASINY